MFFSEYKHQLDDKFRLRLPARFRAELGKFVIMKAVNGCLYVIGEEVFQERVRSKTKSIPLLDAGLQEPRRKIFASMDMPEEDSQGRFVLNASLRQFAGITKNIVIAGKDDHIEIWDADRHEASEAGKPVMSEENIKFNKDMAILKEFGI